MNPDGEEYLFLGYRFRMWATDTLIHWKPVDDTVPDVVVVAWQRTLDAIVEQMKLNWERPQPPEKFWIPAFDKRIAQAWIKDRL